MRNRSQTWPRPIFLNPFLTVNSVSCDSAALSSAKALRGEIDGDSTSNRNAPVNAIPHKKQRSNNLRPAALHVIRIVLDYFCLRPSYGALVSMPPDPTL